MNSYSTLYACLSMETTHLFVKFSIQIAVIDFKTFEFSKINFN